MNNQTNVLAEIYQYLLNRRAVVGKNNGESSEAEPGRSPQHVHTQVSEDPPADDHECTTPFSRSQ